MVKLRYLGLVCSALLGCGGDNGVFDPCASCNALQVCYRECVESERGDPNCVPRDKGCVNECSAGCGSGHPCIEYDDTQVCSYDCVSSACGPQAECRPNRCTVIECGPITPCMAPSDICDPVGYRCYPFDGQCTERSDCPVFNEYWDTHGVVGCTSGYCSISSKPPETPQGLVANALVTVLAPAIGDDYVIATDVRIAWTSDADIAGASVLVLILDGYPEYASDLRYRVVWGAATSAATGELRIADGNAVTDGVWTTSPGMLPTGRMLTLVIEIVKEGTLVAVSPVVPFTVGGGLPKRGDPCDPTLPTSQCWNPSEALSCNPATVTCERVCGSFRDCNDIVPMRDCGAPQGNARYCE